MADLRRWHAQQISLQEGCKQLIAHPRFDAATRALYVSKSMAVTYDAVLARFFQDVGHFLAALAAFSLHWEGGLTLPALKEACSGSRLISQGRARSLMARLVHAGYVTTGMRQGRQAQPYSLTHVFIDRWREYMLRRLEVCILIEPAISLLLEVMDAEAGNRFTQVQGTRTLQAIRASTGHDRPYIRVFNQSLGGGLILAALITDSPRDEPVLTAPIPYNVADLARRCGISKLQVARVLKEGEAYNLISLDSGRLTWGAEARAYIPFATAFELYNLLASACETAEYLEQGD